MKTGSELTAERRRVGRPRSAESAHEGEVGREIRMAAARLFAAKGYDGTSTREIADAVGLRQPSIFHYYPTKDAILAALVDELLLPSLAAFKRLSAMLTQPAPDFYAAVYLDARHLATVPQIARAIASFPRGVDKTMRDVQRSRDALLTHILEILMAGQVSNTFRTGDPRLLARLTLGIIESLIDPNFKVESATCYAQMVGEHALRAVLVDNSLVDQVIADGRAIIAAVDVDVAALPSMRIE